MLFSSNMIVAVLLFIFLNGTLIAKPNPDIAKHAKKSSSKADSPEGDADKQPVDTTSEGYRQRMHATIMAEIVGFTLTPVYGVRAGYFFSRDVVGEAAYATDGAKEKSASSDSSSEMIFASAHKQVVEGKVKRFLTNSFYSDIGLGMELWSYTAAIKTRSGNGIDSSSASGSYRTIGAETHIGNQWQWSHFTVGCDWVGYFLSISSSGGLKNTDKLDPAAVESNNKSAMSTFGSSSFHLLRFYLGASF